MPVSFFCVQNVGEIFPVHVVVQYWSTGVSGQLAPWLAARVQAPLAHRSATANVTCAGALVKLVARESARVPYTILRIWPPRMYDTRAPPPLLWAFVSGV